MAVYRECQQLQRVNMLMRTNESLKMGKIIGRQADFILFSSPYSSYYIATSIMLQLNRTQMKVKMIKFDVDRDLKARPEFSLLFFVEKRGGGVFKISKM